MKIRKKFLYVTCCLSICMACSDINEDLNTDLKNGEYGSDKDGDLLTVTLPFKADFLGDYIYLGPADECDFIQVLVDFKGNGTYLGNFTGKFKFCAGDDWYGPTESYMVAADGDTLFISCEGAVIDGRLDDHPEHVTSYWRDPFVILGGTGRFEGATGSGTTDDYNRSLDAHSHHHWRGTITMVKGKR